MSFRSNIAKRFKSTKSRILLINTAFMISFMFIASFYVGLQQYAGTVVIIYAIITVIIFKTTKFKSKYVRHNDVSRRGWNEIEKEQVRNRQGGKCANCHRIPPRWEYHHRDGNRSNDSLSNCVGLCPNCHSVKTHDSED